MGFYEAGIEVECVISTVVAEPNVLLRNKSTRSPSRPHRDVDYMRPEWWRRVREAARSKAGHLVR